MAGGGIGGLTAALCLAQRGCQVQLFEQGEFVEAGAGIQLSPNCTRVLHHLGIEQALRAQAFLPEGTQFRHWRNGNVITESALGDAVLSRFGFPYYHIHRGDLLQVLLQAAQQNNLITLHDNAPVGAFRQDGKSARVSVNQQDHEGDVLVGADGIHSLVQAELWGPSSPRFTGNIAWRALVPVEALPEGLVRPMSTVWWGPGKHFVHYYVRGGALVNCVCVVEKQGWEVESWTQRGDFAELQADFSGWHDDIQQLLNHMDTSSLYKWALYDREPMAAWGKGRVTLLGDACHPTLPFMAQGAAMAIEDAAVLSACLSSSTAGVADVPAALRRYEDLRRNRTRSIQMGSRRNAKVFHLSGLQAWLRNRAARTAGQHTLEKLFQYDALAAAQADA